MRDTSLIERSNAPEKRIPVKATATPPRNSGERKALCISSERDTAMSDHLRRQCVDAKTVIGITGIPEHPGRNKGSACLAVQLRNRTIL